LAYIVHCNVYYVADLCPAQIPDNHSIAMKGAFGTMKTNTKQLLCSAAVAAVVGGMATNAQASHFRGASLIPSVDANGVLTVVETSFWRYAAPDTAGTVVAGASQINGGSNSFDGSDSRFQKNTRTRTFRLPGAGTYDIRTNACCRVAHGGTALNNWNNNSSYQVNSRVVWDGNSATTPIAFSFNTLQPEVSRNPGAANDYSDNLNALSPDGLTLTYNAALTGGMNFQPVGYAVDPNTGQVTLVGDANRAAIGDNTSFNLGADAGFSGTIMASNGSFVQFDWMFDGVDGAINQAPMVDDAVINALVGPGPINHTFTATDPEDGALLAPPGTWDPNLVLGPGFIHALPMFNTLTQLLTWDTTGYLPGTYQISARAFDSLGKGDFGTLTVNLSRNTQVPAPPAVVLLGLGLAAFGWKKRRKVQS
jgi:hypothetical protein